MAAADLLPTFAAVSAEPSAEWAAKIGLPLPKSVRANFANGERGFRHKTCNIIAAIKTLLTTLTTMTTFATERSPLGQQIGRFAQ